MMKSRSIKVAIAAVAILAASAPVAHAQERVEVGASLASVVIGLGDNDFTSFGVPSGGFGLLNPGIYASIFVAPKIAIEPQVGLNVFSSNGDTENLTNLGAQVNYYLKGTDVNSLFVFGGAGIVSATDEDSTTTFGGGAGYRFKAGDRLTFRADGRFTKFSDDGGSAVSFTVSIGGLFGSR